MVGDLAMAIKKMLEDLDKWSGTEYMIGNNSYFEVESSELNVAHLIEKMVSGEE